MQIQVKDKGQVYIYEDQDYIKAKEAITNKFLKDSNGRTLDPNNEHDVMDTADGYYKLRMLTWDEYVKHHIPDISK